MLTSGATSAAGVGAARAQAFVGDAVGTVAAPGIRRGSIAADARGAQRRKTTEGIMFASTEGKHMIRSIIRILFRS